MKRTILALAALALLGLAGCASTATTNTVITTVAAAEVALTAADQVALAYVTQPQCPAGTVAWTCSDPTTVAKIKSYGASAFTAVMAARNGTGALADAIAAIDAFTAASPPAAN